VNDGPSWSVIAAVLPTTIAFLVDPPPSYPGEEPIEAGAVDRSAIRSVEVLTLEGEPALRPASEPIDREPEVLLVVTWTDAAGEPAEQRLLFRSSWEAWIAADKLREAMAV
jgi:hypothetical protein